MNFQIIAGPCAVESEAQILDIAQHVKDSGATMLRGGCWKPLTFPPGSKNRKPYHLETMIMGLEWLRLASQATSLTLVTEALSIQQLEHIGKIGAIQIGARNMQNFNLLTHVGLYAFGAIIIKRHFGCGLRDVQGAVEWLEYGGCKDVWVCERGISAPHTHGHRFIPDLSFVLAWKDVRPDVPVIVDCSHSTFDNRWVIPVARAAKAIGADGIMVDVHPDPPNAWVDPNQALTYAEFDYLVRELA